MRETQDPEIFPMKRFVEALFSIAMALPIAASAASFTGDAWNAFEPASAADNVLRAATPELTDQGDCGDFWEGFIQTVNTDLSALTDGTVPQDATHGYAVRDNAVVSWTLAEAADIAEFRVYARWGDTGRSTVRIASIQVRHAADGEWETLPDSSVVSSGTAQRVAVYKADDGSAVATGVTAVRINFGPQDNGWNAYVEVEALKAEDAGGTGERLTLVPGTLLVSDTVMKTSYSSVEDAWAAITNYYAAVAADPSADHPWGYAMTNDFSAAGHTGAELYAGYVAWASGDFGEAHGGAAKVTACPSYFEWAGNVLFGYSAQVQVPSAAAWTFSVFAKDGNSLSFVVTDSNGGTVFSERNHAFSGNGDHWLIPVAFDAAGTYTVEVRQFSPTGGSWMELSEASGVHTRFGTGTFVLLGSDLHTVTFDCGEDASTIAPVTVQDGITVDEPTAPTRNGYRMTGWFKDGVAFDFATPVTADTTLVAQWVANTPPVITSAAASEAAVTISRTTATVTLSAVATDADGQTLTYAWEAVGDQPAPYALADGGAASTAATLCGPGTYSFRVTVSDGNASVSSEPVSVTVSLGADATLVAFAGYENSSGQVGSQGTTANPSNDDWPWGTTNTGYKVAWRSTNAGNAANGGRKNLLLDPKRPNAYGLDGYLFFGSGDASSVVTGALSGDGRSVSNVTDYVESFTLSGGAMFAGKSIFWLDDPREAIGADVADFQPGALSLPPGTFSLVGTIRFSPKIALHPVVRIGFLSAYGENWKPYRIFLGNAGCVWKDRNTDYGNLSWHFFDVTNAKPGDELMVWVDTTGCGWGSRIEGIVFDSKKRNGTVLIVR